MVLTTRVASAKAGTKSMKSTVPEGIVEFLQLEDKDELEWQMDIQGEDRRAIVRKKKLEEEEVRQLATKYLKPKAKEKKNFD